MANFAVWHIGIDGRRYKPGERLPEMDDATWKRLAQMGAIRAEYEPGGNPTTSADLADGEDEREEIEPSGEEETDEADDDALLPEIDATEGIVEEEEKPAKRAGKKRA